MIRRVKGFHMKKELLVNADDRFERAFAGIDKEKVVLFDEWDELDLNSAGCSTILAGFKG